VGREEVSDVLGEQVWHLHCGEVAAALELRPVPEVVEPPGLDHAVDGLSESMPSLPVSSTRPAPRPLRTNVAGH
jgi:hypothetical protein